MSDDEDDRSRYNDGNRAFLQSFMARGTMTYNEARPIIAAIVSIQEGRRIKEEQISQHDFDSFVRTTAEAISPFDYEIRSTKNQITKERVWALVNSVSDPLTQMATIRTAEEIAYIKRFLDAMFESYNTKRKEVMAVSDMQALETKLRKGTPNRQSNGDSTQSQTADKGLTTDQTEKLLANLVKEKWISKGKSGYYILTPRALLELHTWLVETYNDPDEPADAWQKIKFCVACKELVTLGQRCSSLDCNVRLHNICQDAFWRSRPNKTCPNCGTSWDGGTFVGTKAATSTDDYLREKRRSGVGQKRRAEDDTNGGEGSSRSRGRARVAEGEGEEEEAEEDAEGEVEEEENMPEEEGEEEEDNGEDERQPNGRGRNHRAVESEDEDEME